MNSPPINVDPASEHRASIIWLHGLGADAYDFFNLLPALKKADRKHTRWVFPNAPMAAVTVNSGMRMPSWFDISSPSLTDGTNMTDLCNSSRYIGSLIEQQGAVRVCLCGFSQGGVVVLDSASRHPVDAVLALSCYHPQPSTLEIPKKTKIMQMHGLSDPVVPLVAGQQTYKLLKAKGLDIQWKDYPSGHEVVPAQIEDIDSWLQSVMGQR